MGKPTNNKPGRKQYVSNLIDNKNKNKKKKKRIIISPPKTNSEIMKTQRSPPQSSTKDRIIKQQYSNRRNVIPNHVMSRLGLGKHNEAALIGKLKNLNIKNTPVISPEKTISYVSSDDI